MPPALPRAADLPVPTTSFVGRADQLRQLHGLLARHRLVTVVGTGGSGKTRLAVEAAHRELRKGKYADPETGAAFVELAPVRDPAEVAAAVARAVRVTDQSRRGPLDKVVAALNGRPFLLVLDNCEHVLSGATPLVDVLLRRLPEVQILATSRTALNITEECRFPVSGLSVPPVSAEVSLAGLADYESAELLFERAAAAAPGLTFTDADAHLVSALCIALAGIPLAIELAVARLRTLTLEQLVDRLRGSVGLLSIGSRTAHPRQQTLRAMIDWSHGLCTPAEQRLWARLSVFEGGFDLAAAESVCAATDGGTSTAEILDLLGSLVDQSILHTEHSTGTLRFRMLETLKAYGAEQLELSGEAALYRQRHRGHFLALAHHSAELWQGPEQQVAARCLDQEIGNLRAVMDSSAAEDAGRTAVELVAALRYRWFADGFHAEGRRWLDEALDHDSEASEHDVAARTRALWVCAWVCLLQGDMSAADQRLDECERLAAALDLPGERASALMVRGLREFFAGDLAAAARRFAGALPELEQHGDLLGHLFASFEYSLVLSFLDGPPAVRADAITKLALARSTALGDRWARAHLLWSRGIAAWLRGDHADAEQLTREAIGLHEVFHTAVGTAWMTELQAWTALARGDRTAAAELNEAADRLWRATGTSWTAFGPHLAALHQQFVVDLGGDDATPAGEPGRQGLTQRQLQIAEALAEGLTNREIADRFVLSVRTVDSHVERILTRLGLSSRTQIALWYLAQTR